MEYNAENYEMLFTTFKASFNQGLESHGDDWKKIAQEEKSDTDQNLYPYLGDFPEFREWVGNRVVKQLSSGSYAIKNKDFEATVSVKGNDIKDDLYNVYKTPFVGLGDAAGRVPSRLVFRALRDGFTGVCYDNQYFFDTDHPVGDGENVKSVSNMQEGTSTPWFLLDNSRFLKPIIFQRRQEAELIAKDKPTDDDVFWKKVIHYGGDMRCNVGYGLWQTAFGSKAELTKENLEAAITAMQILENDEGVPLDINPRLLIVPPTLETAARNLLTSEIINGTTNTLRNRVEILVTSWVM